MFLELHVAEPVQVSLREHCKHAWDARMHKDVFVGCSILPRDANDASKAIQVETVKVAFLLGIRCPGFTAIE